MQASELRIGNLCYYFGEEINVNAEYILQFQENPDLNFDGIPLTEEWLVRFGFFNVEDGIYDTELPNGRYLSINTINAKAYIGSRLDWIEIKYPASAHETQNLYFALTGTELTLKL